jgi:hypothetical protein
MTFQTHIPPASAAMRSLTDRSTHRSAFAPLGSSAPHHPPHTHKDTFLKEEA